MTTSAEPPVVPVRTDWPSWHFPALPRPLASSSVVVFGSALTAFAGLLADAFFPSGRDVWSVARPDNYWPAFGFVACAAMTLWGLWSARVRRRQRGTLYYLRLQNETVSDYHARAVHKAGKEYLGYRSITRWCDPGTGTVDVRDEVVAMSAELERATNDDSDESGYDLAPNLLFPVALAAGFDWAPPADVNLREINGLSNGRQIPEFEWRLGCATASGKGCDEGHRPWRRTRHYQAAKADGAFRLHAWPTSDTPNPMAKSVWLEFRLTEGTFVIASELKDQVDIVRHVGVTDWPPPRQDPSQPTGSEFTAAKLAYRPFSLAAPAQLSVTEIAEGSAYWLGRTLQDYPEATIFIAATMPKIVSFVVGYLLASPTPPGGEHFWRRVVPMGHFRNEQPEMRPMWVRPDQRDPDDLINQLTTGGRAG